MNVRGANGEVRAALVAVVVMALAASCGGPYRARTVNLPNEKLAIADMLFERGKYGDAAVEYKDFLASFAGDERSDYAQFRIAECYRLDEDYPLAAVEYRILINDYGYSEYVDDAFFLEGLCAFEQAPRVERDQTKSFEALSRITRFLELFPESPRRPEAEKLLSEIHDRLGRKAFLGAQLYYAKKHYKAALVYFDSIIRDHPETVWAALSHYYRGAILERRGEWELAIVEYGEAAGSPYDFDEKREAIASRDRLTGRMSGGR